MFEDLSEKLEATFARLRGRGTLSESDIKEGLREVRRVLLEADVNFQLTREFLERREGLKLSSIPPTVIMMVGLQGSGKTTTAGKLALKLKGEGRPTRLIA